MKRPALFVYIVIIFVLVGVAPFLRRDAMTTYVSAAIVFSGLLAILFQKLIHGRRFVEMGFRINRNALIGVGVGALFAAIAALAVFVLPALLGWVEYAPNPESRLAAQGGSVAVNIALIAVIGGAILFLSCLFGEELVFRGYVLPKLEDKYGGRWAVVLCAVVFALWHLPGYFSIYSGGAEESGWASVAKMLLAHGISVVPICLLYMTTRELYGVSLYHALMDVVQYSIVANPDFGEAARDALYRMTVRNETAMTILGWGWHVAAIFIMLGLCRVARRWTLKYHTPAPPADGDEG